MCRRIPSVATCSYSFQCFVSWEKIDWVPSNSINRKRRTNMAKWSRDLVGYETFARGFPCVIGSGIFGVNRWFGRCVSWRSLCTSYTCTGWNFVKRSNAQESDQYILGNLFSSNKKKLEHCEAWFMSWQPSIECLPMPGDLDVNKLQKTPK